MIHRQAHRTFRTCCWLPALLMLGLAGCAGDYVTARRPIPTAPPFSSSGDVAPPDRWWMAFDDSNLNLQMSRGFAGNLNLDAALHRLRAARAVVRREASDLFPDLDGITGMGTSMRSRGEDSPRFSLGLEASYEPDIWGRIGYGVEAENLRASATLADYNAVALTLSGQIAQTWFALVEARAQYELLLLQVDRNLTGLELQEARWALGQVRSPDVLRQRQLVESTREQAVIVQLRIDLLEHQLAVLLGEPPQQATFDSGATLPELPPLPDTGLPADLLRRRPDVQRAYRELWAADRDLASAISNQYPRLNLGASVTTAAEKPENLYREWLGSLASQLIAPLFDGGQRQAEIDRTAAVIDQRFAEYGQTMLNAFREVEDALARERFQRERIARLTDQLRLANEASLQLREQYFIGETEYLDVLSSITEEQRLQRQTLSARLDLVLSRIALYLALSGDFESR